MPKRVSPEAELQRAVSAYLDLALGPGVMWRMVENRPRSKIAGALQKARGVRAGTPDILLWWLFDRRYPRHGFGTIELKSPRGVLSITQRAFLDEFDTVGGRWAVCRSVEDVEAALRDWGLPLRGSVQGGRK